MEVASLRRQHTKFICETIYNLVFLKRTSEIQCFTKETENLTSIHTLYFSMDNGGIDTYGHLKKSIVDILTI